MALSERPLRSRTCNGAGGQVVNEVVNACRCMLGGGRAAAHPRMHGNERMPSVLPWKAAGLTATLELTDRPGAAAGKPPKPSPMPELCGAARHSQGHATFTHTAHTWLLHLKADREWALLHIFS
jgi:hypothetical protein